MEMLLVLSIVLTITALGMAAAHELRRLLGKSAGAGANQTGAAPGGRRRINHIRILHGCTFGREIKKPLWMP